MITIREEKIVDVAAREALLDAAYGASRFTKASERLREGRLPANGLSLVAVERGRIVGTVRLWDVTAGPERPALLLGELWMPGRFERDRLLALELKSGALTGARGLIAATGALAPKPDLAALVAIDRRTQRPHARRALAA